MKDAPLYCIGCGRVKYSDHPAKCRSCKGEIFTPTPRLIAWEKQLSQQDREFLKVQRIDYK